MSGSFITNAISNIILQAFRWQRTWWRIVEIPKIIMKKKKQKREIEYASRNTCNKEIRGFINVPGRYTQDQRTTFVILHKSSFCFFLPLLKIIKELIYTSSVLNNDCYTDSLYTLLLQSVLRCHFTVTFIDSLWGKNMWNNVTCDVNASLSVFTVEVNS